MFLFEVFKEYVVQVVSYVFQDFSESFRIFYNGVVVVRFGTDGHGGLVFWEIPGYQFLGFGMEILEICLRPFFYGWTGREGNCPVFLEYVYADIFKCCFGHLWFYGYRVVSRRRACWLAGPVHSWRWPGGSNIGCPDVSVFLRGSCFSYLVLVG